MFTVLQVLCLLPEVRALVSDFKDHFSDPSTLLYRTLQQLTANSSPLNVHWTFGGEGVRESQDLDIRVGNLGQNQNNVLKETHFTHVDNRT